jgi:hypothetical protein
MAVIKISPGDLADFSAQILSAGSCLKFQASGGSMRPFILSGDILWVMPVAGPVKCYDVLLFYQDTNRLCAHRVVRVSNDCPDGPRYLMKGDVSAWPDGWIERRHVLGRIEQIERNGTQIAIASSNRILAAAWHLCFTPLMKIRSRFFCRKPIEGSHFQKSLKKGIRPG